MSKINILQVVGKMNCGGAETMIMNIFRNIDRESFQFHFLYYTDDETYFDKEIIQLGGIIHRLKISSIFNKLTTIKDLQKLIITNSINVVHAHTSLSMGIIMYAARKSGVPIRIAHSHTTVDSRRTSFSRNLYAITMKYIINSCSTHYLMCSKDSGLFLYSDKCMKKAMLLPNAIDLKKYNVFIDEIDSVKSSLSIPKDTLIIGQIGSFKKTKNHKFTIKIANELKTRGIKFIVLFAGDGELKNDCIDYSKQLGVDKNIRFLGNRSDINILMNIFDVLIMPSLYEGLPLTLVESQAAGLQSIISDNISRECDMGLGLIEFLSLSDSISHWVNNILTVSKKRRVDRDIIDIKIKGRGYSIEDSVKLISKIYSDDRYLYIKNSLKQ